MAKQPKNKAKSKHTLHPVEGQNLSKGLWKDHPRGTK